MTVVRGVHGGGVPGGRGGGGGGEDQARGQRRGEETGGAHDAPIGNATNLLKYGVRRPINRGYTVPARELGRPASRPSRARSRAARGPRVVADRGPRRGRHRHR